MLTCIRSAAAWRHAVWCSALAIVLAVFAPMAGAAPLSLDEALALAQREAPNLAASTAKVDAARQSVVPAGELPDPKLALGIDNYPISGPDAFSMTADFMTMRRIGVMQEVPNSDKRRARREVAEARLEQAGAEQQVVRREVRRDTALAWIARLTVEKKLAQFVRLEQENRLLTEVVRARIAGGQGRAAEEVMPRLEALELANQRDELEMQQRQAVAGLRRWLGQAAEQPMSEVWPAWPVGREALQAGLHQHPELIAFDPMGRVLAAEVREAEAAKRPDWAVDMAYQRRGSEFGDMMSLEFRFDLPVFAERRQDPLIAAKQAERIGLDAAREGLLRQHAEELERDLAEYERLERVLARQRDTLLPLLTDKFDLMLASYRAGKSELAEVIAARAERQTAQLQLIGMEGQKSATAARLHFVYGEDTK